MLYSALYAAASLKRACPGALVLTTKPYSAALCRGLIEAPRRRVAGETTAGYSAALCRGLIEASAGLRREAVTPGRYSAALCRGLIEASENASPTTDHRPVFRGSMPRPH